MNKNITLILILCFATICLTLLGAYLYPNFFKYNLNMGETMISGLILMCLIFIGALVDHNLNEKKSET